VPGAGGAPRTADLTGLHTPEAGVSIGGDLEAAMDALLATCAARSNEWEVRDV